jgi:hypothetical protein
MCKKARPAEGIIAAFDFAARRQAPLAALAKTLSQFAADG